MSKLIAARLPAAKRFTSNQIDLILHAAVLAATFAALAAAALLSRGL